MPTLSQYSNVADTALAMLQKRGYQVWRDDEAELYYAERDGWDFAADDPVGLLGLTTIYEAKQPAGYREYWWRDDAAAGLEHRLPTGPENDFVSVMQRDGSRR